jgi:hypothetical protein
MRRLDWQAASYGAWRAAVAEINANDMNARLVWIPFGVEATNPIVRALLMGFYGQRPYDHQRYLYDTINGDLDQQGVSKLLARDAGRVLWSRT